MRVKSSVVMPHSLKQPLNYRFGCTSVSVPGQIAGCACSVERARADKDGRRRRAVRVRLSDEAIECGD